MENSLRELEQDQPTMGRYGRAALRHIKSLDETHYCELLKSGSLYPRILEREAQAQTRFRTIIEKQEALENVEEISDFLKKVSIRNRIKQEADSIAMREIILQPM